jgi:Xaa-Pro aminopeptidase
MLERIVQERAILVKSPIELAKSIKNDTEIAGMKAAYLRDGIAWSFWMARLEPLLRKGGNKDRITEWDAAEELTSGRKVVKLFAGLAYENISATAGNAGEIALISRRHYLTDELFIAALPHYAACKDTAAVIDTTTPYLNDSGANYRDGTIDNTRTYHFGRPTAEHK